MIALISSKYETLPRLDRTPSELAEQVSFNAQTYGTYGSPTVIKRHLSHVFGWNKRNVNLKFRHRPSPEIIMHNEQ